MKTSLFSFICLLAIGGAAAFSPTQVDDQLLRDQPAIEKLNQQRPQIYFYTDFGGGHNGKRPLTDLQTSGEIASAAWKDTLQQELYINDSATPLNPFQAALHLAKTFPYAGPSPLIEHGLPQIKRIVVHVIDPGVGNDAKNPQPRALVLRKDGTLFIGPDNGTLSFACPPGSIAGIWEINPERLNALSGIDVKAGGTFHGRDIFAEAALRISSETVTPEEIGTKYPNLELKQRFKNGAALNSVNPLIFETVHTERFLFDCTSSEPSALFDQTFLLGTIQSSLYPEGKELALTHAKKIYLSTSPGAKIGAINEKTGNIYIGPNNGLATPFLKGFTASDLEIVQLSDEVIAEIQKIPNNEAVYQLLKSSLALRVKYNRSSFWEMRRRSHAIRRGGPTPCRQKFGSILTGISKPPRKAIF